MLLYGNFVFAYRTLSRIKDRQAFLSELGEFGRERKESVRRFRQRRPKLLKIDPIERQFTHLVGYLSATQIAAEYDRCKVLKNAIGKSGRTLGWKGFEQQLASLARSGEEQVLIEVVRNFRHRFKGVGLAKFEAFLEKSESRLGSILDWLRKIRQRATRNQNTYLTWDHMDVYFATSMRRRWEFEDLYDFIAGLMCRPELGDLNIRYFDPTQAYAANRVDKGLVEALMLKRARCTVYSVQDTDTLGKDSELAATLAQGKPVIAYVPTVDVRKRAKQLLAEDPVTILERLRFVIYPDERLSRRLLPEEYQIVSRIQDELQKFESKRIWRSLRDKAETAKLKSRLGTDLGSLCRIIATSEATVYEGRARTLKTSHPLAIQVNLTTGVANGLLVVRSIGECAALLRRILLCEMAFDLEQKDGMWYLRERISGCIYRVVTNDRKISNCFWNFYLH